VPRGLVDGEATAAATARSMEYDRTFAALSPGLTAGPIIHHEIRRGGGSRVADWQWPRFSNSAVGE
jgi:hypothetical protein